ncbi:phage baseplate plug family protein [Desertibacillus haloalkaliphilus]|uniref:phage baseplate plug family protein n=1 Tax=Desertibacillus haloalkaliphilus TaxID=1328930 RepID=UPI001C27B949|nr:hypothetical protein [Desertibacillus haloalkaliphilus]MBU8908499.1 hypothetical protein [Desertibacillus haloalkaliphilus]
MIIPIQKEQIPNEFEIRLAGELFTFEVHYNAEYDFFTVDLYKSGDVLVLGEKVVYDSPLFDTYSDERFPGVTITPLDRADNEDRVTYSNLGNTVFLYVSDDDG